MLHLLTTLAPISTMYALREPDLRRLGARGPIYWEDLAAELEGHGQIAFPLNDGLIIYPGKWKGVPDGNLREMGWHLAEDRLCRWMRQIARPDEHTLGDAASYLLGSTSRERALAPLAPWLAGLERGGGAAARQRSERALWAAFRGRLRELESRK